MAAALSFDQVLDDRLAAALSSGDRPLHGRPVAQRPDPGLGVFGFWPHAGWPSARAAYREVAAHASGRRPASAETSSGASAARRRGPRRPLDPSQRAALALLRRAGVRELDAAYDVRDLKSAFRDLARRYHPDAHPGATSDQRRVLAETFGRVVGAYRVLLAA